MNFKNMSHYTVTTHSYIVVTIKTHTCMQLHSEFHTNFITMMIAVKIKLWGLCIYQFTSCSDGSLVQ